MSALRGIKKHQWLYYQLIYYYYLALSSRLKFHVISYCRLLGEKEDETQKILGKKMIRSARIVERMINQNIYNDIAQGI